MQVDGKTGERQVPVSPEVLDVLWRAVRLGSKKGGSNEPPFVGRFCPVVGHLNATEGCAINLIVNA